MTGSGPVPADRESPPPDIDISVAHVARVYDYWLGGKTNFTPDQVAARAATAKEQGVPAYVIFHDATLREFAARCPATLAELGTVSGVGESKLAKYGQQVLDTLDTDRPEPAAPVPPE